MNRRFLVFLLTFSSVLLLGAAYVSWRLSTGPATTVFYILPFIVVIVGFFRMVFSRREDRKSPTFGELLFQRVNYILMGWLSFLFVFTLARDFLGLSLQLVNSEWSDFVLSSQGAMTATSLAVVTLLIGMYPALRGPRIKRVTLNISNLSSDMENFTLAQVSDLHIGLFIGASFAAQVSEKLAELKPTMIALTGDIFDSDYEHFHRQALPLADLSRFAKVFFVSGNHEYYWQSAKWFELVKNFDFEFLQNENRTFKHNSARILVGGIVDPAAQMIGQKPDPQKAVLGEADFKILLAHQPQVAEQAEKLGFDLQLSGHTHGGQFFPWTLVVRKVHKYHQGLFQVANRMWIYVSPGTGFWGPPVRLGTLPEITFFTFKRA